MPVIKPALHSDLMSSYARMRGEGIVPAFCFDHGITMSLYYKDPDGNFVELQSDNFGDWKRSTEWMRTSADFRSDPIRTFFDSREDVSSVRERPVVRGATARHPRWEVLTGLDPQHRLAIRGPQQADEQETECNPNYIFSSGFFARISTADDGQA